MDGFQTFASSRRGGVCFSGGEAAAAGSFSFAARLPLGAQPAAPARTTGLTPGGIFLPNPREFGLCLSRFPSQRLEVVRLKRRKFGLGVAPKPRRDARELPG